LGAGERLPRQLGFVLPRRDGKTGPEFIHRLQIVQGHRRRILAQRLQSGQDLVVQIIGRVIAVNAADR
jgi:hypothetical protein